MAKTIFPEEGFHINDLLTGVTFQISDELLGMDEDKHEFSKNVFMSNDDMLKFLNMEDFDSDDDGPVADSRMPWDLSFDRLRSKMTDLLKNGLVMKFLKREGAGEMMSEDAQVSVRYIAYVEHQDESFDASYSRGSAPDVLQLGQGTIISGLEVALRSMKKHEISVFLIKPEYAYGIMGVPPRIPPNQEVLFVVHLTNYADSKTGDNFCKLPTEEKRLFCNIKNHVSQIILKAFENFRKEKIKQAIGNYTKAVKLLEGAQLSNEEEEGEQKKLLTRVYGNLTICFNKENKPRCACSAFNQIPIPSAKAYFNHGRALIRLGEFERAKEELLTSRRMEPNNRATIKEQELEKKLFSKYNSMKKRLEANCFLFTGSEFVNPEFENVAEEICATLQNDANVLRLVLPDDLTRDEDKCLRETAVNYDLSVVNHERYGREIVFLAKANY